MESYQASTDATFFSPHPTFHSFLSWFALSVETGLNVSIFASEMNGRKQHRWIFLLFSVSDSRLMLNIDRFLIFFRTEYK